MIRLVASSPFVHTGFEIKLVVWQVHCLEVQLVRSETSSKAGRQN